MTAERQYCTFHLGGLYLGIEVTRVQEVIRHQQMTPVPLAPSLVGGLINLRGQIVTAIDLRERLGLPPRSGGRLPMNVVVRTDDGAISLLVDEIGDVVEVLPETFEGAPETLTGVARELIVGTYKLPDRLLLVLDTDKAVNLVAHTGER
jgi:purine-binding chemotaxis protein CheW